MNQDLQKCGCVFPNATSVSVNDDSPIFVSPSPVEMASRAPQAAPVGSYTYSTKKGKGSSSKTSLKAKKGNGEGKSVNKKGGSKKVKAEKSEKAGGKGFSSKFKL
jgi:hypothetical protein